MKIMHAMRMLTAVLAFTTLSGCAGLDAAGGSNLAADVQQRLSEDAVTARLTVGVSEAAGVVTLTGQIRDAGARARAISIARGTPGVREVADLTTR